MTRNVGSYESCIFAPTRQSAKQGLALENADRGGDLVDRCYMAWKGLSRRWEEIGRNSLRRVKAWGGGGGGDSRGD